MADGAGYDLSHETPALVSLETAIELLEAGETCTKFRVEIGEGYVVATSSVTPVPELLQRLRGHAQILALVAHPEICEARPESDPAPALHPKVTDILDALE